MICPTCGTQNAPGATVCVRCGSLLAAGAPPPAYQPPPAAPPPSSGPNSWTLLWIMVGVGTLAAIALVVVLLTKGGKESAGPTTPVVSTGASSSPSSSIGPKHSPTPTSSVDFFGGRTTEAKFCGWVPDDGTCQDPYPASPPWTVKPSSKTYAVRIECFKCVPGDVIKYRFVNNDGSSYAPDSTYTIPAEAKDASSWFSWYRWTAAARKTGHFTIQVYLNGRLLPYDPQLIVTVE